MKQFLEAIEKNPELKTKVEALCVNPEAKIADYIALAKEYGYEITEEDFKPTEADKELFDDELGAVTSDPSRCFCFVGGGGAGKGNDGKGNDEFDCACVVGGGGAYKNKNGETKTRCICVAAGTGRRAVACRGENGDPFSS